jgi:hypothetical protein
MRLSIRKVVLCMLIIASVNIFSQTTFSWVNYTTNSAYTPWTAQPYMYIMSGSGFTDYALATITSSAGTGIFQNSTPKYSASTDPAGAGCSTAPPGLFLSVDWTNSTSNVTITIDFSGGVNGVCGPLTFSVYDINDDGFGDWQDAVAISATDNSGTALNVTKTSDCNSGASPALAASGNGTTLLTFRSGQSSSCTCWPNNAVTIGTATTVIKTLTIKYQSIVSPSFNNSPQYVSISNISTGGFGCAAIVLPVEISSFNGKCSGTKKTLQWTTATETNNNFFSIEHSKDGYEFAPVGKMNSRKNNSTGAVDYEFGFEEENPNYKYYRLKQTDLNGKVSTLKSIYLDCVDKFNALNLFPNPTGNQAKLEFDASGETAVCVKITDVTGREMKIFKYPTTRGTNTMTLDIDDLPNGFYYISVSDEEGLSRNKTLKFSKNN